MRVTARRPSIQLKCWRRVTVKLYAGHRSNIPGERLKCFELCGYIFFLPKPTPTLHHSLNLPTGDFKRGVSSIRSLFHGIKWAANSTPHLLPQPTIIAVALLLDISGGRRLFKLKGISRRLYIYARDLCGVISGISSLFFSVHARVWVYIYFSFRPFLSTLPFTTMNYPFALLPLYT